MFHLLQNLYRYGKKKRAASRTFTVTVIGLDNAGKSTVVSCLKDGVPDLETAPTVGFSPSTHRYSKYALEVYDLGGGPRIRGIWRRYFGPATGLILVVDAADEDRFPEIHKQVQALLAHPHGKGKPLLVLANKQDLPDALPPHQLASHLGLLDDAGEATTPFKILPCSAIGFASLSSDAMQAMGAVPAGVPGDVSPRAPENYQGGLGQSPLGKRMVDSRIYDGYSWLIAEMKANGSHLRARLAEFEAEEKRAAEAKKRRREEFMRQKAARERRAAREANRQPPPTASASASASAPAPAGPSSSAVASGGGVDGGRMDDGGEGASDGGAGVGPPLPVLAGQQQRPRKPGSIVAVDAL